MTATTAQPEAKKERRRIPYGTTRIGKGIKRHTRAASPPDPDSPMPLDPLSVAFDAHRKRKLAVLHKYEAANPDHLPEGDRTGGAGLRRDKPKTASELLMIADHLLETRMAPLEFLFDVMECAELPMALRMDAAKSAAPYAHPRLSSMEVKGRVEIDQHVSALRQLEQTADAIDVTPDAEGQYSVTDKQQTETDEIVKSLMNQAVSRLAEEDEELADALG